jgi:cation/acetate symporter
VLSKFGFSLSELLGVPRRTTARSETSVPRPGAKYGVSTMTKIDFISLSIALVLGTAGLPHMLMRFYTVPTSKEARKSVVWAIGLIGLFYLFSLVLGFGARRPGRRRRHRQGPGGGNSPRAARRVLAYDSVVPCCWASSRRSPSPRSWRWSQG